MRASFQLLGLGGLALIALAGAGCDDFDVTSRGPARPTVNGGSDDDRRITVNGGEDLDPLPGPTRHDGGSPAPRSDGGVAPAPKPDSKPPTPPKQDAGTNPGNVCGSDFESQVFTLVNQERAKAGLSPLKCDPVAGKVAHDYSQLQCDSGQIGHDVGGTDPFQRMQAAGIKFSTAGENVAAGQQTPGEVMQAWMSSPGHRANILGNYAYIGVGYVACSEGGGGWLGGMSNYWTQDFWE